MSAYNSKKSGWRYDFMHNGIRYTKANFSTKELAEVGEETRRKEVGAPPSLKRRKGKKGVSITTEQIVQLVDEWGTKTVAEFAKEFNVSASSIYAYLKIIRQRDPSVCKKELTKRAKRAKILNDVIEEAIQIAKSTAKTETSIETTIVTNPIVAAIIRMMHNNKDNLWTGTPSELLYVIEPFVDNYASIKTRIWPRGTNSLSAQLRRNEAQLQAKNIIVTWPKPGQQCLTIQQLDYDTPNEKRNLKKINTNHKKWKYGAPQEFKIKCLECSSDAITIKQKYSVVIVTCHNCKKTETLELKPM